MKILFVRHPRNKISIYADSKLEPLEFELLAAPLKNDHDLEILDMQMEDDHLTETLNRFKPDVVALSSYTLDVYAALHMAGRVKKHNPDIKTVIGGHHATIFPQDFCHPAIDIVVIGNGEVTFREVITALEKGANLEQVPGIAVNSDSGQVLTPRRPVPADLEGLPAADRSLTKKYRSRYYSNIYHPIATMITSRGCPFRCKFCSIWKSMEGKYLIRDVKSTVDELEQIEEPYVFFVDDDLSSNFNHFEALHDEIKRRGIQKKYKAFGRTDAIVRRPELIEKWSKLGLVQVTLGAEAIKDENLQYLNKRNTVDNNIKAIRILKENGIDTKPCFIIRQDFGEKEFEEMYQFVQKEEIDTPYFTILTPLPGTDLYNEMKDQILLHHYEFYDLAHSVLPTKLPKAEFYRQFLRLYGRCYSPKKSLNYLFKKTLHQLTGKPAKLPPPMPLRKAFFYSMLTPLISGRRYKQEQLLGAGNKPPSGRDSGNNPNIGKFSDEN